MEPATMSDRHRWIHQHRKFLLVFSLLTGLVSLSFLPRVFEEMTIQWWMLVPVLIGVLYTGFPGTRYHGLREIPVLKAFLVALVWTMLTFLIPHFLEYATEKKQIIFLHQFLLFWSIAIWFDWRDKSYDHPKMFTIPQLTGTAGTTLFSVLAWLGMFFCAPKVNHAMLQIDLTLFAIFLAMVVLLPKTKNPEHWLGLGMDGIIFFQAIALLLCK